MGGMLKHSLGENDEQNAVFLSFLSKEVMSKSNKSVILQINMQYCVRTREK